MPQAKSQPPPRSELPSAPGGYVIRPCRRTGELEACVHLQQQVWGYEPAEVYPVRLLVNLTHIGGHVLGAFQFGSGRNASKRDPELRTAPLQSERVRATAGQGGELVGFVMAMPAWRDRQRYLHSLSLAVAPGHENRGLGRLLKLGQRELAIQEGIARIEWTFDPLRAKNAFLNIERLGAITRRYQPDYYGSVRSRLQQGLPSDRLVCEWWVRSARVGRALEAAPHEPRRISRQTKPAAEIAIPVDFGSLAARDSDKALELQRSVRRKFERCFKRGFAVTGFERGDEIGRYIFEPWVQPGTEHKTQRHRGTERQIAAL